MEFVSKMSEGDSSTPYQPFNPNSRSQQQQPPQQYSPYLQQQQQQQRPPQYLQQSQYLQQPPVAYSYAYQPPNYQPAQPAYAPPSGYPQQQPQQQPYAYGQNQYYAAPYDNNQRFAALRSVPANALISIRQIQIAMVLMVLSVILCIVVAAGAYQGWFLVSFSASAVLSDISVGWRGISSTIALLPSTISWSDFSSSNIGSAGTFCGVVFILCLFATFCLFITSIFTYRGINAGNLDSAVVKLRVTARIFLLLALLSALATIVFTATIYNQLDCNTVGGASCTMIPVWDFYLSVVLFVEFIIIYTITARAHRALLLDASL